MDVTLLRLIGFAGGLVFLLLLARALRGSRTSPPVVGSLACTGAGLILVSAFPGAAGAVADLLQLGDLPAGRLITVLILATAVAWVWLLGLSARHEGLAREVDRLVRANATRSFLAETEMPERTEVLCIVPAYGEAENLAALLPRFPAEIAGRRVACLVVDDGSPDGTAEVAARHGALVARSDFNRGQGSAMRIGFDVAERLGAEIVVTIDADGQNNPEEIAGLVEPILGNEADFVIGSRMLGRHDRTNTLRHVGVHLFSRMVNLLMGTAITDISSGFRAFRLEAVQRLPLRQNQYQASEVVVMAAKRGMRITERAIHFRRRTGGKSKKGPELLYGARFAYVLLSSWLRTS